MSLTLGEKLRQAREERGIPLSEVAEQTRISALYLQSIDNDDYRNLPGGIFNKGFVKSYAKYVGIDEQEALMDYSRMMSQSEMSEETDLKIYKPEVLTDDRPGRSMLPTVIIAAVILTAMTLGVYFGVNYLRQPTGPTVANKQTQAQNSNTDSTSTGNSTFPNTGAPDMATVKIVFKALKEDVSLTAKVDGKSNISLVRADESVTFEPKESLELIYSRSKASNVQLTINDKPIAPPAQPLDQKRSGIIDFVINKDNLTQIWTNGAISTENSVASGDNANISTAGQTTTTTKPTPGPKPTPATNTAPSGTPVTKPAGTPKPAPSKPAGNKP